MPNSRPQLRADSPQFLAMCEAVLETGARVRFHARGMSMQPNVNDGEAVELRPADPAKVHRGEIVLSRTADGLRLHRVVQMRRSGVITRGDAGQEDDAGSQGIIGKAVAIGKEGGWESLEGPGVRARHSVRSLLRRAKLAASRRLVKVRSALHLCGYCICLAATILVTPAAAQNADLALTQTVTPATVAAGGTLTYTEVITNNGPGAATTPTLSQQTPPNTTFASITAPAGWTCTTPAAGGTGQIRCNDGANLANAATASFTLVLNVNAGTAAGTSIQNAADVTSLTPDPNQANNTTLTTVNVEVAGQADLALSATATPSPAFVFSTLTYTLTVQNLGLANTANGTLTDILPGTATFVSANSTQGSCVQAAGTVTCTLGAINFGSTVTVTLVVTTPGTPSTITDTANVTSTTIDPVAGNNNVTVSTDIQPLSCSTPAKDGAGGTLSGTINTYFPPNGVTTLAAGSTSVALGAASGTATPIAAGDRLLIIEMQDADIDSTNTGSYGDGLAGDPASGASNLRSAGQYEFVTATNAIAVTGGTLTFTAGGAGGGLLNTYESSAYVNGGGGHGQRTFQVIRVPQYSTATLSSGLTALAWNGSVGGVLALDAASQLTLGGTVSVDGLGFRGGAGRQLAGGAGAATDYRTSANTATNGSKGEGIAGTPRFLTNRTFTAVTDTGVQGYLNGSYARGAAGNSGGGGTDGNPAANDQNTGGGGGANGGAGGKGGFSWNTSSNTGGFGGAAYPATVGAVVMGGGGGAGTTNNGTADPANANPAGINSSGGAGGGIVIIHAGSVTGTGTITANGQAALNVQNDGAGGGGAGGTIIVLANSGGLSGLTAIANGGVGGSTWLTQAPGAYPGNRHGPGGGGGGGTIFLSAAPASLSVSGGTNGQTTQALDAFGSTPGSAGISSTNVAGPLPGTQSGGACATADLAVTNAGSPNPVTPGSDITYTQVVTNNGPLGAVNAVFSEAIPANTTFQSLTVPAGWTCTTPAVGATGNVNCTNPLVANAALSSFTLVVQVNGGTPNQTQITDVASVSSGTQDPVLSNNSASVTIIVSVATGADLQVTNTGAPNPVVAGQNITYTQVVTNAGPVAASTVTFTETLPANTTFVSMPTPAGWSCTTPAVGGTGTITCTIATLAVGASATFQPVLKVTAGTPIGTVISDTASVGSTTPDPNPNSNDATANVTVAGATQADLSVTTSASPNPVLGGNNITFAQTVTNSGPIAAATNTFTETVPANTTFVSLTQPAGWTCVTPAVGATGTITCTSVTMAANTSASFPLVVKVNQATAPGTVISNNPSVSSAVTGDPNSANNSASASTVVAGPTQADVSIVKTASPEPVDQNINLVYTLQVRNNGPATAQGVTVSDPLPAQVTFSSVSTTQGSCTQSAGTVTCNLGTMSVGSLAVITINVTASTFSSATTASNTATVSSTTSDPNVANNSSTVISTIQSPTAVQLVYFKAIPQAGGGTILEWKTRDEVRNLGFNAYREDTAGRHRLNPSLIAGSALVLRHGHPQHAAKTYRWLDAGGFASDVSYWIEDVDLNGSKNVHGPARIEADGQGTASVAAAPLLAYLNRTAAAMATRTVVSGPVPEFAPPILVSDNSIRRAQLGREAAVKISVQHEGWYRVSGSQLVAAGLDPRANARTLQLFAEGLEQPMLILGNQFGPLGPNDAIEFYGTGIDTPFSDTRVYWLISGIQPGKRISLEATTPSTSTEVSGFPATVIREDRTTYFAVLLNGEDKDNFFGALVTSDAVDQEITVAHSVADGKPVTLDVTLQGVTEGQEHAVSVYFNGASLGTMNFTGQENHKFTFAVDPSLLRDGSNTTTLAALNGENDVSLVQTIALHYSHSFAADADWLRMQVESGSRVRLTNFSRPQIRVFDVTNPVAIEQVAGTAQLQGADYGFDFTVPGTARNGQARTLIAVGAGQVSTPAALSFHAPSHDAERAEGAHIVVITHPDFAASVTPLVGLRQQQGQSVKVVTTDELFDVFNFGERSPFALRDFLHHAATQWRIRPQAVLLVGDASLDPRDYLGFGDFDFVPSRLIETAAMKTASDDWFTDFNGTGFGTIPIGRLPVRTAAEADLVVSKIVDYERGYGAGSWNSQALAVADQTVGADFTTATNAVANSLERSLQVTKILGDQSDPQVTKQKILDSINSGQVLVNYLGHGSVEQWSFSDVLDNSDAASLSNGNRLPVFLIMDCLNGFFQDVYTQSLAESLLLAPNGGAVAVWASSGFTDAPPQAGMDQALAHLLATNPNLPIGRAILLAKAQTADRDVRRTWILFGDPAMRIRFVAMPPNTVRPPREDGSPRGGSRR